MQLGLASVFFLSMLHNDDGVYGHDRTCSIFQILLLYIFLILLIYIHSRTSIKIKMVHIHASANPGGGSVVEGTCQYRPSSVLLFLFLFPQPHCAV